MAWIEQYAQEGKLLDSVTKIFTDKGWLKVDQFLRFVLPSEVAQSKVIVDTIAGTSATITLPPDVLRSRSYRVFVGGTTVKTTDIVVDKTQNTIKVTGKDGQQVLVYHTPVKQKDEIEVHIAEHVILQNMNGKLYGIATYGSIKEWAFKIPASLPFSCPSAVYYQIVNDPQHNEVDSIMVGDDFFDWAGAKYRTGSLSTPSLFFYQLENYIKSDYKHDMHRVCWPSNLKQAALDIEVARAGWGRSPESTSVSLQLFDYFPGTYQSPIVEMVFRNPLLENNKPIPGTSIPVEVTNWYNDSTIEIKGFVDAASALLILQADTGPEWLYNAIPSVPVHMGEFDPVDGDDIKELKVKVTTEAKEATLEIPAGEMRASSALQFTNLLCAESTIKIWVNGYFHGENAEHKYVTIYVNGQKVVTTKGTGADEWYAGEYHMSAAYNTDKLTIAAEVTDFVTTKTKVRVSVQGKTKDVPGYDALFAGTAVTGALVVGDKYNFQDVTPYLAKPMLPLTKEYPNHPGNGIDNIIVRNGGIKKYRYQAHYITADMAPNMMPPDRKSNKEQYFPRSWQGGENDEYNYRFNPSAYTNKVETSWATLIHPEDGDRGILRNMLVLNPLSLLNGDELYYVNKHCPDEIIDYRYFAIDGVSPITKRPSVEYCQTSVGVRHTKQSEDVETHEPIPWPPVDGPVTTQPPDTGEPVEPVPDCGVAVTPGSGSMTETMHYIGKKPGTVNIQYDMYSFPDKMEVFYGEQLVATTNDYVADTGTLTFEYNPVNNVFEIKVIVSSTQAQTGWTYTIECPS